MKALSLKDFNYELDPNQIPAYPLEERDSAKLLFYRKGEISHHLFKNLPELLPKNSTLVFNTTRVIPARLFFHRETGARIEVLLLEPVSEEDTHQIMQSNQDVVWECMVGGLKKWKVDEVLRLKLNSTTLSARIENREKLHVKLSWDSEESLSEILEAAGKLPLPPYLNRDTEESDKERYQTVYAANDGAVAAPTAGLHFTDDVLKNLSEQSVGRIDLTLHVGAGTFKPVKAEDPRDHDMHLEKMLVKKSAIEALLQAKGPIIPVGTTSMRTLESLYWWGVALDNNPDEVFFVKKLQPYSSRVIDRQKALENILDYMNRHHLDEISGGTEILIYPSYSFQLCDGLITNFHLPETTLIMLVAAFVGDDWRKIYQSASENKYRFLSFGDSSLLLP